MPKLKSNINLNQINQQLIQTLCKELGIQPIVATLLVSRGIENTDMARDFLFPNSLEYCNPYQLPNMERIIKRINCAIDRNEKIVIYGDYDVDGITASTLLLIALKIKGAKTVDICIPDRHQDGYGLNIKQIEQLKKEGTSLIITVDCGITAHYEIEKCHDFHIDVIVTDHHQLPNEEVSAYAVTNPLMLDLNHPMRHLCGAGVAFKIAQALNGFETMERLSQYAAMGTIADIVPIKKENRLIVYHGLVQINKQPYPGIAKLIEVSGLNGRKITSENIAFGLAPRINAAGRIDTPYVALDLFLEKEINKRSRLASKLNELNNQRKNLTQKAFHEAEEKLTETGTIQNQYCLISCGTWNPGIIGIVASKILEVYYRPTIIFAKNGDCLTGSARSIEGINIYEILKACSHLFVKFGGHSAAAGITIKQERYEEFKELINNEIQKKINKDIFRRQVNYDLLLNSFQINADTVQQIEMLEPFGQGNAKPVFLINEMNCSDVKKIGKNRQHLMFKGLLNNMEKLNCIYFNANERTYDYLNNQNSILTVGTLNINKWNGQQQLQYIVNEIIGSGHFEFLGDKLARNDFASIYLWLKKLNKPIIIHSRSELYKWYKEETNKNIASVKFQVILNIFQQVRIVDIKQNEDNIKIELNTVDEKIALEKNQDYIDYQNYVEMF